MQSKSSIKQKLLLIIFGLFIALLLTEGFFRIAGLIVHEENILPSEKKDNTYRILCIGDSSTYGLGSTDSEKYSYPAQLHTLLNTQSSNNEFEVVNLGVRGINSSQVVNRFKYNILKYNPDMVIVMIGINDGWNLEESNILKYYNERFIKKLLLSLELIVNRLKVYQFMKLVFIPQDLDISTENLEDSSSPSELIIAPYNDETRRKGFRFSYRNPMKASAFYHALNDNITSMVKIAESQHIQAVFMTYHAGGYGGVNKIINQIYAQLSVPIVDIGSVFKQAKKLELDVRGPDKWHPNDLGYSLIAKSIYNDMISLGIINDDKIELFPMQENK
ncbi:MAG TPA: hypothetical protein ENH18_04295 [Nitrospirae bacterium]|nr:hypothetical protein [Nitrospirota bacterium]HEW81572.1 hypothetical protein [Nitrospirota bacterium]